MFARHTNDTVPCARPSPKIGLWEADISRLGIFHESPRSGKRNLGTLLRFAATRFGRCRFDWANTPSGVLRKMVKHAFMADLTSESSCRTAQEQFASRGTAHHTLQSCMQSRCSTIIDGRRPNVQLGCGHKMDRDAHSTLCADCVNRCK